MTKETETTAPVDTRVETPVGGDPLRTHAPVGDDPLGKDLTESQVAEQNAEHFAAADRILTPERASRFEAARVHTPAVREAIIAELAKGRTEDEVSTDLEQDIAVFEKAKAESDAKQAEAEAEAAKANRRVEVLSTAAIVLGHLVAAAKPNASQAEIAVNAVNLAEAVVDAVDKRYA